MGFRRMNSACYKCGKLGCAKATDNDRQYYCHRYKETYFMCNTKGQGGHYDKSGVDKINFRKKEKEKDNEFDEESIFDSVLDTEGLNHYDRD